MKYYMDENNKLRGIGEAGDIDGDQSFLVQESWVEMSVDLTPQAFLTMEGVNSAVQKLTDSTARVGGFSNMTDAYAWAFMYNNKDALRLQEWDKKCWDAVDALNGVAPLDLEAFLNTLPN